LVAVVLYVAVQRLHSGPSTQDVNAATRFQQKLSAAMKTARQSSLFSYQGQPEANVVQLLVSDEWYSFSPQGKSKLTERLGGVWLKARREAGIKDGRAVLKVFDLSRRQVSEWSDKSGARVLR
jgi:hypothetical protein